MKNSIYFANRNDTATLISFGIAVGVIAMLFLIPWLWGKYRKRNKVVIRRFQRKGRSFGLMQKELQQLLDGLIEMKQLEQAMLLLEDYHFMKRTMRRMCLQQFSSTEIGFLSCYHFLQIFEKLSLRIQQRQSRARMLKPKGSVIYLINRQGARIKFTLVHYRHRQMKLMTARSTQIPMQRGKPWGGRPCTLLLFPLGKNGQIMLGQGLVFRAVPASHRYEGQASYLTCQQLEYRREVQLAVRRFQRRYAPNVKVHVFGEGHNLDGHLLNLSTRGCSFILHAKKPAQLRLPTRPDLQLTFPDAQGVVAIKGQICAVSNYQQQHNVGKLFHIRFLNLTRASYLILANYVYSYDLPFQEKMEQPSSTSNRKTGSWVIGSPTG